MPKAPKPAHMRQRRNKTSTSATLRPVEGGDTPELPRKTDAMNANGYSTRWLALTRRWWEDVWSSPMVSEWDSVDFWGLVRLAVLLDEWWRDPASKKLASEVRMLEKELGLTPLSRRRLQWEIDRGEQAKRRTEKRRKPQPVGEDDPRRSSA